MNVTQRIWKIRLPNHKWHKRKIPIELLAMPIHGQSSTSEIWRTALGSMEIYILFRSLIYSVISIDIFYYLMVNKSLWSIREDGHKSLSSEQIQKKIKSTYKYHSRIMHDDVIKWKKFPRYWPFVQGIHRSPVNSPHKGQWRGTLMFSLICSWTNGWVNNREAGNLRRH